ncbi:hypothetical protein [Clostridium magnum]|uniref:hypothetical protein n=1 Tax=Clostridium magnum TaxID=33954 RepID=UPI0009162876|nr:hypothetical protein [Clostridium magnum]SHJ13896.1 hypothetical protein SAMN02745944_05427 [Clostridium magnum DSM 2767]
MILSVITIGDCYDEFSEMLIPKTIGTPQDGFAGVERMNRLLPPGYRYHGYEV